MQGQPTVMDGRGEAESEDGPFTRCFHTILSHDAFAHIPEQINRRVAREEEHPLLVALRDCHVITQQRTQLILRQRSVLGLEAALRAVDAIGYGGHSVLVRRLEDLNSNRRG